MNKKEKEFSRKLEQAHSDSVAFISDLAKEIEERIIKPYVEYTEKRKK